MTRPTSLPGQPPDGSDGTDTDSDLFGIPGSPVGFDPARDRLRMTPRHFAALTQLAATGEVTGELAEDLAALRAAGVVDGQDGLTDRAAELVAAFTGPSLLVHVETTAGPAVISHAVAVRHRTAWTSESFPGTAVSEFAPLDPIMLVPAIARIVNLLPHPVGDPSPPLPETAVDGGAAVGSSTSRASRPAKPPREPHAPLRVPTELVDRAWLALELAGPTARERAATAVRDAIARLAPQVPGADLDRFTDVLVRYRLAWRVTTSWQTAASPSPTRATADTTPRATSGAGGTDADPRSPRLASHVKIRALAVVDAGPAGLWRRDEPNEPLDQSPGHDSWITLTPVTTSQVWHALTDLLPGEKSARHK